MKKYKKHLLAFLIPFSILSIIFILKGVLSNNDLIVVSDLKAQGIMFYDILKKILLNTGSLTYNYSLGMGTAVFSTILFYCTSPLNIILLFFNDIVDAYLLIYIIKLSLAGLTMYLLLKYKFKKDNIITILFSTCYALCSFAINYFYLPFWLDGLYLAPLTILGIEKILDKEKFSPLYIFSLALTIICNIQIGFGLCIFSLIYFIYSIYTRYEYKKDKKRIIKDSIIYIISSLLGALIASGTIIGMLNSFNDIYDIRRNAIPNNTGHINLLFTNMFSIGHYIVEDYNNINEPFIYCGLIITILSILYFFNNKINKKKKIGAFFIILFFIISFFIEPLNIFWQLSNPNLVNFRYSFYLSLFLVLIGFECYIKKVKYNKFVLLSITLVSILTVLLNQNNSYVIPSIIAITLYLIILLIYNKKLEKLLIIIIIIELLCNTYLSIHTKYEVPIYTFSIIEGMEKIEKKHNFDLGYRLSSDYSYTDLNKSLLNLNNSSLRYFSSIMNNKLVNYLYSLDFSIGNYYREAIYSSPFILSFLGNKYFYLFERFDNDIYELKDSFIVDYYNYNTKKDEQIKVHYYDNPYALSLGFMINQDVKLSDSDNIIDYQNKLINYFNSNNDQVFIDLSKYALENSTDCPYHSINEKCVLFNINKNNSNIYIYNGPYELLVDNDSKIYVDMYHSPINSIKTDDEFFKIALIAPKDEKMYYSLYTYDDILLKDNLKQLQENMLYDVNIDKNILTGKINAKKEGILFLSIPYDNKFEITVDGEKVDYYGLLDDNFIGLDLKQGSHDIKLEYKDNLPLICLLSSTISLIISLFVIKYGNKYIEKKN